MIENNIKLVEVFIQESASTVNSYLARENHRKPDVIILDNGDIGKALGIYQIPRIILLDSNLKVFSDGGPMLSTALKQKLLKMLAEK